MCGIFGKFSPSQALPADSVEAILAHLRYRGPDDSGVYRGENIILGHTRLSILDLSPLGHQPMLSANQRYVLSFNGEIYNYTELKAELKALGNTFIGESDSEVLLVALALWGKEALNKLNGMFAFAFWDRTEKTLLLARDRLGKKPLYYALGSDSSCTFGSTLSSVLSDPSINYQRDPEGLAQYLTFGYTLSPRTIAKGVSRLPAAHWIEISAKTPPKLQTYWNPASIARVETSVEAHELEEQFRELFLDAVRVRLRSDVPLGVFLSSGLDSAAVVWAMRKLLGKADHIQAFGAAFSESSYDELKGSKESAALLDVKHRHTLVSASISEQLSNIVARAGEPVADTSILPMYELSRFTREHVTVALSGDGADELFFGYSTYLATYLHSNLRPVTPPFLTRAILRLLPHLRARSFDKIAIDEKIVRLLSGLLYKDSLEAHLHWRQIFSESEIEQLVPGPKHTERASLDGLASKLLGNQVSSKLMANSALLDIRSWLAEAILTKVDRSTMGHALEVRSPFLDYRIVEFALALPLDLCFLRRDSKPFLRGAFAPVMPSGITSRKKSGFNPPLPQWLAEDPSWCNLVRDLCADPPEQFSSRAIQQLYDSHLARRTEASFKLFSLLTLREWERQLIK